MRSLLIYIIILIVLLVCYNVFDIIHFPAQGAHLWRQADCLAMVWNFKQSGTSFFVPEMYNLLSIDGKGVAEFPIFYYIAAKFPNPELVLRTLHSIMLFVAGYRFFQLAKYFLQSNFYSISAVVLVFTSPLIIFYGINFLSDVPAFSCCIIGLSFYFSNHTSKHKFMLCILFLSLATLLKASYFLYLFGIILYEYKERKFKNYNYIILFILICLPIIWYLYAFYINSKFGNTYYFLSSKPIYSMSLYDIGLAIWRITVSWSKTYFWRPTSVLVILFAIIFLIKSPKNELKQITLFTLIITILFVLLFMQKLIIHEYYYAFFYTFILFAIIALFSQLKNFEQQQLIKFVVIVFLVINVFYCKYYIIEKQQVQRIDKILFSKAFQEYLNNNDCDDFKTVFCFDDISLNQQLYAIKRKGFTQYNDWKKALNNNKIDFVLLQTKNINKLNFNVSDKEKYVYRNYTLIKM